MTLVFDLILLLLIAIIVWRDTLRGFVRTALGFFRLFLAFFFALLFSSGFALLLKRVWPDLTAYGKWASLLSFLTVFIASYLLLRLLAPLLSKAVRSLSFVKAIDTVGGMVFGVFHAFLWGWLLAIICGAVFPLVDVDIKETVLIEFLNGISPLKFINWIILR